jgi:hypothetical protein
MKRHFIVFITIFVVTLLLLSCDDTLSISNDITINNKCGATVEAAVTNSTSPPSPSEIKVISDGGSADFSDVSGTAYLHIKSTSYGGNNWYYDSLPDSSNNTYSIDRWTGNGYDISYYVYK